MMVKLFQMIMLNILVKLLIEDACLKKLIDLFGLFNSNLMFIENEKKLDKQINNLILMKKRKFECFCFFKKI